METWWPYDLWAGLSVNRSAFVTWPGHVFCSCAKHFSVTVPLSTQEYKWVAKISQGSLKKCQWGGWGPWDGLASHQGGSSKTPSRFMRGNQVYKLTGPCDFVSVYPSHSQPKGKTHLFCYWVICWTDIYHHLQPSFFQARRTENRNFLGEAYSYSCNGYSKKSNQSSIWKWRLTWKGKYTRVWWGHFKRWSMFNLSFSYC